MPGNKSTPALGIIFHPTFPPETLINYARQAESAGFDELWLWDDCFLPGALTAAAIALSVAGTPEQAADSIQHWMAAGMDSLVLQPLNGDPDCLEEYSRYLMPLLRA